MSTPKLPPSVHVIVRDWLCANNILLRGSDENVLVDTGYVTRAHRTLDLLQRPAALGSHHLHRIVNTHGHSDHIGGNAAVQRVYGSRIAVPAGEAALVRDWDTRGLWLDYAGQEADRFMYDEVISPGATLELGGLSWLAVAAPGHDMGALVFYCAEERILISGDALWQNGFGVLKPEGDERPALKAARATLETLARLPVTTVIPGHGRPFHDFQDALERAFRRVEAFEADSSRVARHFLKVMLAFTLLHLRRLPERELVPFLERTPCYREVNAGFLGLEMPQLGELLTRELTQAGVIARRGGFLVPLDVHEH
ncbi:MAG TPA: MBL fold metallo-hydrolase [Burkholderiales bacterium]|nr:MBL fold metallo-hydrolase [Burkholderiales bacterium]